jgi:hypothetical protein
VGRLDVPATEFSRQETTERTWARDGENEEKDVIDRLKATYAEAGWRGDQFQQLSQHEFERYYPSQFQETVSDLRKISDKASKRAAKKALFQEVEEWVIANPVDAKAAFAESAHEIIGHLKNIASELGQ